jgi:hypothetical protein
MTRRILFLFAVCVLAAGMYACNAKPATPVAPTPSDNTGPDGSTLKASAPSVQSPANNEKIQSGTIVLRAGAATLQYESASPVTLQYRFQVLGPGGTVVDNALVNDTTYEVQATLADDTPHTWRVRVEAQGQAGPWSSAASFVTRDPALVVDPLTNRRTVGNQIGGVFCPGSSLCPDDPVGGWLSTSTRDGIDYDIPTCDNCTVEFDITNIGKGEGVCCMADLKFMSMGDATTFNNFGAFRNHRWKMHLNQRGDGDGSGLEVIWRNGRASEDGNPGDHRNIFKFGGPDFRDRSVFHFVVKWTPGGFHISVGVNGGAQVPWLVDGFGNFPYRPPNHRVQLGNVPRGESFPRALYRNIRIYRNR